MEDPRNLGEKKRSTNIPSIPSLPPEPTPQEELIRGLSANKIQRMAVLLEDKWNIGDISTVLRIPSSVIAMFQARREEFDTIRGVGRADPRNLSGEGVVGGSVRGGEADAGGRNYRPGVVQGPIGR